MSGQRVIALLGRPDAPTDAVEEYCRYLGDALQEEGFDLSIERVAWAKQGWASATRELRGRAKEWRGVWVFLQYTALSWSRRGFPNQCEEVLNILRAAGARIGVVFHDVAPYGGKRLIDRLRRYSQLKMMRQAVNNAHLSVFTVPLEKIEWIKKQPTNAVFIPVGANLPVTAASTRERPTPPTRPLTVAVFGITGGQAARNEITGIAEAVRIAATEIKGLKLTVIGRNSESIETELRHLLRDVPVEVRVAGLLAGEEVVRELSASDVLLFLRGHISTRRGSAIAGIACGLPLVACAGADTAAPITEAGIELYEYGKQDGISAALLRVLKDDGHRASLAARSRRAQDMYFSWSVIAKRFAEALDRKN